MTLGRILKIYPIYVILVLGKCGLAYSQDISDNYVKPKFDVFVGQALLIPEIDSAYYNVELDKKIGLQFGVGISIPVHRFTINARLVQEIKGFKGSYNVTVIQDYPPLILTGREKFDVSHYYTSIALYSTYFIGKNKRFGLGAGGYASILNKTKIAVKHIPRYPQTGQLTFQTAQFQKHDFGILFNAQFRMPLNKATELVLGIQKDIGLQNTLGDEIMNDLPLFFFNGSRIKNNGVSINLALRFSLPKPEKKLPTKKIDLAFKNQKLNRFVQSVSLVGGPSIGFLRGNPNVETTSQNKRKTIFAYTIGVGLKHKIDRNYSIDFLFIHESKGGASSIKTTLFDPDTQTSYDKWVYEKYNFRYWTVPIILNYAIPKISGLLVGIGGFASHRTEQSKQSYNKDFEFGLATKVSYTTAITDSVNGELQILNTNGISDILPNAYGPLISKTNNTSMLLTVTKKLKQKTIR